MRGRISTSIGSQTDSFAAVFQRREVDLIANFDGLAVDVYQNRRFILDLGRAENDAVARH